MGFELRRREKEGKWVKEKWPWWWERETQKGVEKMGEGEEEGEGWERKKTYHVVVGLDGSQRQRGWWRLAVG